MTGILCLDKPQEMTSFIACAKVRRLLGVKKAGHAGTLDPMATGVLPVLVGGATKALDWLPSHEKRYLVTVRFGAVSDTQDIWGTVQKTGRPLPDAAAIEAALPAFRGEIWQVPPMTSALKKDGVRLYELARQGIEVERDARRITVSHLELMSVDGGEAVLDCRCSKGTYMRTIAADLGKALGCGAVMTALRRTEAAGFSLSQALTLPEMTALAEEGRLEEAVLPIEQVFAVYPDITVTDRQATRFQNGGGLLLERLSAPVDGVTRVYAPDGRFLGLGTPKDNTLAVARLFLD
ncbi:MAG: tRNA pseudouridine(55) synthase TruB [Clostridia bacterium]|nr:tRNA pseudouridine(55) synthase TruB [Clostridia bacterium]